ncbi:MAG TPA: MBL fold metallo-hydrolase [Candidatus Saccharimonadales bacterium]|nr:MBL fold metallo-hydrolase [Candidatus Saccharimonadales bacterium]
MEITHLGNGVVKLANRNFSILVGPTLPKGASANVVALTEPNQAAPASEAVVLDGPGEYELSGVHITGVAAQLHVDESGQRGTIYAIDSDEVVVACLANIAPGLSDQQLEAMGQVDVLIIPVGGKGLTLDATAAAKIVSQVEPHVVIPIHYDDGKSKYATAQDKVDPFLKELGAKPEEVTKYKITAKDMPEETVVVVIKPEAK